MQAVPEMLTTGQAAKLLGVTKPMTIYLADTGQVEAIKVGRLRLLDRLSVEAYRDRKTTRLSARAARVAE
jgi:excisionase family DNA binding protein